MSAMESLFAHQSRVAHPEYEPLAVRMRPVDLNDFVGQEPVVGAESWLRQAIQQDRLISVILYGPSGSGKTTLARIVAHHTQAEFRELSALTASVKDVRTEIDAAEHRRLMSNKATILFIDEIHRFSKSQQDALLKAVEERVVVLIGATTENPLFEVNSALLSRSHLVELHALKDEDIRTILHRALSDKRGYNGRVHLEDAALDELVVRSAGDARAALSALELAVSMTSSSDVDEGVLTVSLETLRQGGTRSYKPYDKQADQHYDIISAFIKSMRGSDPDAALYWLARMIDAGEDPKFIARRIFICASEDIGNADPLALLVAEAAFRAVEVIGLPECRINLAQAVLYLARAPKSNAAEAGIDAALAEVRQGPLRAVPDHLKDRHRPGSDEYPAYQYPHAYPHHWIEQQYLPDGLERGCFYTPSAHGWEAKRERQFFELRKVVTQQNQDASFQVE